MTGAEGGISLVALDVAEIRDRVTPILARKGARKAVLFGSYARGTADRRSDVDLIVVDDEDRRYLERIDKYFAELAEALGTPVELLVYRSEELERMTHEAFVKRALAEGVVIYERREEP